MNGIGAQRGDLLQRNVDFHLQVSDVLERDSTEVCTGVARTKEQSPTACPQPDPANGLQRPSDFEGQTRAQLILARKTSLQSKAEYICADLSSQPNFSLHPSGGPYIYRTNPHGDQSSVKSRTGLTLTFVGRRSTQSSGRSTSRVSRGIARLQP
jgi:hypothetical protein